MSDASATPIPGDEKASNLRAIFEILSYIHVDAQRDNYTELAERIDFALNLAERMIKGSNAAAAPTQDKPQDQTATTPETAAPTTDGKP
ncbi:MAG: hypothetical protein WD185_10055 [Sneathiella sp.]